MVVEKMKKQNEYVEDAVHSLSRTHRGSRKVHTSGAREWTEEHVVDVPVNQSVPGDRGGEHGHSSRAHFGAQA